MSKDFKDDVPISFEDDVDSFGNDLNGMLEEGEAYANPLRSPKSDRLQLFASRLRHHRPSTSTSPQSQDPSRGILSSSLGQAARKTPEDLFKEAKDLAGDDPAKQERLSRALQKVIDGLTKEDSSHQVPYQKMRRGSRTLSSSGQSLHPSEAVKLPFPNSSRLTAMRSPHSAKLRTKSEGDQHAR